MQVWQILLIILAVLVVALAVLYFVGRRLQKKQAVQQEQIDAAKQNVTMLVIDKKRLPIKDSGLPQVVIDKTPKLMRRNKLPIVKAKLTGVPAMYGSKIMTMVADERIFDIIPVKKEIRATISGIYITDVRGLHSPLPSMPKKQKFSARLRSKLMGARQKAADTMAAQEKQNASKNSVKTSGRANTKPSVNQNQNQKKVSRKRKG